MPGWVEGHVIMFSFNPFWRGGTQGSYALVFNALLHHGNLDAGVSRWPRTRRTADPPLKPPRDDPPNWWRRHLHRIQAFIARTYYQVRVAGAEVPVEGPVLLVANHPNSLMDPPLLAMAAGRPVRFLAGAHLFRRRSIAWAVRGSGAIPVFRRSEEPGEMEKNQASFGAVRDALLAGSVVGVFPEGFTHSEPSLVPLKTGAARMALLSAEARGTAFPILPWASPSREERSGSVPGRWSWWGSRYAGVTWPRTRPSRAREGADAPHRGSPGPGHGEPPGLGGPPPGGGGRGRPRGGVRTASFPATRCGGLRACAAPPRRWKGPGTGRPEVAELHRGLEAHVRVLAALGLTPRDLHLRPRSSVAVRWTLGNLFFFGFALPLALVGTLVFWLPWTLVQRAEPRFRLTPDRRATYRVLAGAVACGAWVLLLSALVMELRGWRPALALLLLLPLTGFLTLRIRTRWRSAVADLRRFLVLRGRRDVRSRLLEAQRGLALSIRELQNRI
jgi:glycerol-3-phosphate O-acyltransferase / dihydroxyacetone phosphate acyltransferase